MGDGLGHVGMVNTKSGAHATAPLRTVPFVYHAAMQWSFLDARCGAKALVVSIALLLVGCASWAPVPRVAFADAETAQCDAWLARLDEQVDGHAVRDGGSARIGGLRFVRVDRLLASFANEVGDEGPRWEAWGQRMVALDAQARAVELRNLPPSALEPLGIQSSEQGMARVTLCGPLLWQGLTTQPQGRDHLRRSAKVPDDYQTLLRWLGLYPLTRWPFFWGVEREHRLWRQRWTHEPDALASSHPLIAYRPAPAKNEDITALLANAPTDALGLRSPDPETAQRLLAAFAPVFEVETAADHDRPGKLYWGSNPSPETDPTQVTVYQRLTHTRSNERPLIQLVYSLWFPERPARSGLDLLAGRVDAVVIRLTLDERGRVLVLDSVHGCGCYHVFVPAQAIRPRPAPDPWGEWAFVPTRLPSLAPGQRLRVRISAFDHQLVGVLADMGAQAQHSDRIYKLSDEDGLRSLPLPGDGHRSAFWSNGIMPGTERGERALFWPMGIASPGAMRQWGRQPTAFVGRRHFDDPDLFPMRFDRDVTDGRP